MAATEQLHPDDRPPEPEPRRAIPRGLLWALALAVVVLTIASWMALSAETPPDGSGGDRIDLTESPGLGATTDLVGRPAPGFVLPSLNGGEVSLDRFRGTPIVVNFWASTCTPCIAEMPELEHVHQRYGDRVQMVGIATADISEPAARQMVDKTGVTYPSGFDAAGRVATSYGTSGLPSTYVVDAAGVVTAQWPMRAVPIDELTAALDRLAG